MSTFLDLQTKDVRFPTSRDLDGSDAMNPEPDYSAAYVVLVTDADDGLEGHGFAFTTGRGNDIQTAAIHALAPWIVGRDVEDVLAHLGDIGRGNAALLERSFNRRGAERGRRHAGELAEHGADSGALRTDDDDV